MTERDAETAEGHRARQTERIAWVERAVLDQLGRAGPQGFVDLNRVIPVRPRNLGFALARLTKAGTVVKALAPAATGTKAYPTYTLATKGDGGRTPGQAPPQETGQAEAASHAPAQVPASTADRAAEATTKPRRRGRPKGFVPGSANHHRALVILRTLEVEGALTQTDLRVFLGTKWPWLTRPLARLKEEGKIIEASVTIRSLAGQPVEIVVFHLPGQDPIPVYARPCNDSDLVAVAWALGARAPNPEDAQAKAEAAATDDPGCAGCDQAGAGRGVCASCARKAGG